MHAAPWLLLRESRSDWCRQRIRLAAPETAQQPPPRRSRRNTSNNSQRAA